MHTGSYLQSSAYPTDRVVLPSRQAAAPCLKGVVTYVTRRSPQELWETVLGQLEIQVTRPNFETWLRGSAGLRIEDQVFVVGVTSDFAREWLGSRMAASIARTITHHAGEPLSVQFEVLGAPLPQPQSSANGHPEPAPSAPSRPPTDPRFTFDTFVAHGSARLATRAAHDVASGTAKFNPLVIFGPPGLGKTHLLHAVAADASSSRGEHVIIVTGEQFVSQFGQAVRMGRPHTFSDTYHRCHLLVIDDLQFLSTRVASQEQFFHIFNSLLSTGGRVVISLDRPPSDVSGLTPHLASRLGAGLLISLTPPSEADRLAILRAKEPALPEEVFAVIAQQNCDSVRELEGALNRLTAYLDLTGLPPTSASAREALRPFRNASPTLPPPSPAIIEAVCQRFHLSQGDLAGQSRARDIAYARHIAMFILHNQAHLPLTEVGRLLGGRDHTTVLYGTRRIRREMATLPSTQADVQALTAALSGAASA